MPCDLTPCPLSEGEGETPLPFGEGPGVGLPGGYYQIIFLMFIKEGKSQLTKYR